MALAQAGELEVLLHPQTEGRGHVSVLSQRVKEEPLRGTLRHEPGSCQRAVDRRQFR